MINLEYEERSNLVADRLTYMHGDEIASSFLLAMTKWGYFFFDAGLSPSNFSV